MIDTVHAWCAPSSDADHADCPRAAAYAQLAPHAWTLHFEGGRGLDEHTFPTAGDARKALAIEAREGWQGVRDLGRPDLLADPPADDAEAIRIFTTALDLVYSLDVTDAVTPTYYRHRNDDYEDEIVVRAWLRGAGTMWGFTVTGDTGGIDPCVTVSVRTDQAAAHTAFRPFFEAFSTRRPSTLDEVAALLNELGAFDDTPGHQQRRAETDAALSRELYGDNEPPL
ncbi:hypothetical protein [Nonomuraea sp. NPDC005650]|uniref:hypothetical protein n=1 Tax=Nonomuraea sp. NPDC005650 TaxID=3157045 RepID=UPI0033BF22C7